MWYHHAEVITDGCVRHKTKKDFSGSINSNPPTVAKACTGKRENCAWVCSILNPQEFDKPRFTALFECVPRHIVGSARYKTEKLIVWLDGIVKLYCTTIFPPPSTAMLTNIRNLNA